MVTEGSPLIILLDHGINDGSQEIANFSSCCELALHQCLQTF